VAAHGPGVCGESEEWGQVSALSHHAAPSLARSLATRARLSPHRPFCPAPPPPQARLLTTPPTRPSLPAMAPRASAAGAGDAAAAAATAEAPAEAPAAAAPTKSAAAPDPRLSALRAAMAAADGGAGVDAYIIPTEDPHMVREERERGEAG